MNGLVGSPLLVGGLGPAPSGVTSRGPGAQNGKGGLK